MKFPGVNHSSLEAARICRKGFTLSETMTAMAIFSMIIVAVVYSHIFGIKMFNLTATKLSASNGARVALGKVREEIRSGKIMFVGNGDNGGFTNIIGNKPHEGNALKVCPTVNTNAFVVFYVDPDDQKLKRKSSLSGQTEVIASFITNRVAFRSEDYKGTVLTNDQNNRVIKMTLEFYQWEYPSANIAIGSYYDYYKLQTRITRRTID